MLLEVEMVALKGKDFAFAVCKAVPALHVYALHKGIVLAVYHCDITAAQQWTDNSGYNDGSQWSDNSYQQDNQWTDNSQWTADNSWTDQSTQWSDNSGDTANYDSNSGNQW